MISDITLRLSPKEASQPSIIEGMLKRTLPQKTGKINEYRVLKRSIDARKKDLKINLTIRVATGMDSHISEEFAKIEFKPVKAGAPIVIIVGAGPAGLFAALEAIKSGWKPIVLERGKDVDSRRIDLAKISREGRIDPISNYCFGEGGAGAYSDGKLYTRSKKRGNNKEVLQLLVQHGAKEDILIDAHPHIGSDKLPHVIKSIRQTILNCGGEVHFLSKVEDLLIQNKRVNGVRTSDREFYGDAVILAIGHSARDTVKRLHAQGVKMEPKGIAVGVRLEHPQDLIDRIQYHTREGRGNYLPAAEYSFVSQIDCRGVYSFCMCPGGVIVPAGSQDGELVVNGMSASARSGSRANSGMVVEIRPGDFKEYEKYGELELLKFQEDIEHKFFVESGDCIKAPAQRMEDFIKGRVSTSLPSTSYAPGIHTADFSKLFPSFISERLKSGFQEFGRKAKGFLTNDAILVGLESRTSSPVRIPRERESMMHTELVGLYPVGEGAGYAGGIISAAVDGMQAMKAVCSGNGL